MANIVDEPSHLDLHCLNRYVFWSTVMKGYTCLLQWWISPRPLYLKLIVFLSGKQEVKKPRQQHFSC